MVWERGETQTIGPLGAFFSNTCNGWDMEGGMLFAREVGDMISFSMAFRK
jgi:fructose-1,6-bisphosphatase/inositol monophosphatase family enzyme